MLNYLIQFLLFFLILFFQYFCFGQFLLKFFKLKLSNSLSTFLSLILSFCFQVSFFFFFGPIFTIRIYYFSYLFLAIGTFYFKNNYQQFNLIFRSTLKHRKYLFILLIFSLIFSSTLFFSGLEVGENIIFQDFHDSIWHLALINKLKINLPPVHPSSYLFQLKNYHYFYDLLIASISVSYLIDVSFLYFQIFIPLISFLLVTIFFNLILSLTKKKSIAVISSFLFLFSAGFTYLIPLFLPNHSWGESNFWVSNNFANLVNPQLIFSFLILLLVIHLLSDSKNINKFNTHLLISFLIASSMGFKSYAFLVCACLYSFFLFFSFCKDKNFKYLKFLIIFILISLPFFLLLSTGKFPFFWQPLWFIDTMVEASDRLNLVEWKLKEETYLWLGAYHQYYFLKAKEILIFFLGNLGTRFIFIFFIFKFIKQKSSLINSILATILIFSIFPLLFLQTGVVWNSIQFWYYVLALVSVLFSLGIFYISKLKFPLNQLIIFIIIILSLPTFIKFYLNKITKFDKQKISSIQFIQTIPTQTNTLICPSPLILYDTSWLSYLINSNNYLVDPVQLDILKIDSSIYENQLKQVLVNKNDFQLNQFIKNNQIKYLICDNKDYFSFLKSLSYSSAKELDDILILDFSSLYEN